MRIVFVCLGNICRSPAAEAVARVLMPEVSLDSAGTSGWHIGDPPYGPMQAAARARGYDLSALRARAFRAEDFLDFDSRKFEQFHKSDLEKSIWVVGLAQAQSGTIVCDFFYQV